MTLTYAGDDTDDDDDDATMNKDAYSIHGWNASSQRRNISISIYRYNAGIGMPFYAGLSMAAGHLAWQIQSADVNDPLNLQQRFTSNKWFGALVFSSVIAGNIVLW